MLILTRYIGQSIIVDGPCKITLHGIETDTRAVLAIACKGSVTVRRGEQRVAKYSPPPANRPSPATLATKDEPESKLPHPGRGTFSQ